MNSEDRFLVNAYYTDRRDPCREVFVGGVGVSLYGEESVYYFRDSGAISVLGIDTFKENYTPSIPKPGETWKLRPSLFALNPRVEIIGIVYAEDCDPDERESTSIIAYSIVGATEYKRFYTPVDSFLTRYARVAP